MHRWILLAFLSCAGILGVASCANESSNGNSNRPDAGPSPTTTTTTTPPADARRTGCLDRPTNVPRADGRLPCELIPPGLAL